MATAAVQQIALMAVEMVFVGALLLAAFRLRGPFGSSLVYIIFGGIFQTAALLAGGVYVQLTPWLIMSPGSVVLFPAALFVVLYVYMISDALEARKLIYALAGANVLLMPLSFFAAMQLASPVVVNPYHLPPQLFILQPRIVISSAVVLFIDTLLVCLLYEWVSRYTRWIFLRVFISLSATLYFDSVAFVTAAFAGDAAFSSILVSQLVGKTVAALGYAIMLAAYLRLFGGVEGMIVGAGRELGTMLRVLTYRQRYEELQKAIDRDALTNVYNRGFFDAALDRFIDMSRRSSLPLSLLMIDVDDFKRVNDTHGHAEGDRVLQKLAMTLAADLRASDCVCRYGGDEFAILLPQTDLAEALASAHRIVADVPRTCSAGRPGANRIDITVTVGVATLPHDAADGATLLRIADRRLYDGKAGGRNRAIARDT